jgi:hypothetical protein
MSPHVIQSLSYGLAFVLLACSGQTTIYQYYYVVGDAAVVTADGAAGTAGGHAGSTTAGGGGAGGAAGFWGASGNAEQTGIGGTSGASGEADAATGTDSSFQCVVDSDCPPPASACQAVSCNQGVCETSLDQNKVPTPPNPCLVGTCNSAGSAGTAPAPASTPCAGAVGAKLCDGMGNCVECLHSIDCRQGQVCSATGRCVTMSSCTDVDCGGTCPPCADGKQCLSDQDCASAACDAVSHTCIANECTDHRQDGLETDADCGGGVCPLCELGKSCLVSTDCASRACDAVSSQCVSNQCADHRQDGFETDIDCGGGGCSGCNVGQMCKTNFDCISGHFCNGIHKCQ